MLSVPIHQGNQIRTTMQSEEPDVSESIKEEYMCFAFFFNLDFHAKRQNNVLKSMVQAILASRASVMGVFVRKCDFFVARSSENFEFLVCGMGVGWVNFWVWDGQF